MAKDLNRHFFRDAQVANEHMQRYSALLVIGKRKSKPQWATTSYSLGWLN